MTKKKKKKTLLQQTLLLVAGVFLFWPFVNESGTTFDYNWSLTWPRMVTAVLLYLIHLIDHPIKPSDR